MLVPLVDFPANPSLGQLQPGPAGEVWMWDGSKWVAWWSDPGSGGGGTWTITAVTISSSPPANAATGNLWWDNTLPAGRCYIRYQSFWVQLDAVPDRAGLA
jgi:hypothetical protein